MPKSAKRRIVRRKTDRLLGHANFLLPPEHQAAIELQAQAEGERSASRLYQKAIAEYIERNQIAVPTPAQVAEHFGGEWVKKHGYNTN